MNIATIIAVASGGAIGATIRLFITDYMNKNITTTLPLGTLSVNLLGSFIIGILFAYFHINTHLSPNLKFFLVTGMLGALTTYSTFAMESFLLLQNNQYLSALLNMTLNLFGTIFVAGLAYVVMLWLSK